MKKITKEERFFAFLKEKESSIKIHCFINFIIDIQQKFYNAEQVK